MNDDTPSHKGPMNGIEGMYGGCMGGRQHLSRLTVRPGGSGKLRRCDLSQGVNHRDLAGSDVGDPAEPDGVRGAVDWLVTAANPRDLDAALAWQLERVGSRAWRSWSLKFQRMAFGYSQDTGWHDEAEAWQWLREHGQLYDGLPPRGALIWYSDKADAVRVVCSLGRGRVVGPLPDSEVGIADLAALSASYAWSAPLFPFAH